MCSIAPPHLRREQATQKQHQRLRNTAINTPLKIISDGAPTTSRLKSRKPFYRAEKIDFDIKEAWSAEWREHLPKGGELVEDPTDPLPGFFHLPRKQWSQINRLRCGHGKTAANLYKWYLRDSPTCPACQMSPQDTDHLVLHCPITSIPGGYQTIHEASQDFMNWTENINLEV